MPSGRTHDRITLWCLPIVAVGTYVLTQQLSWMLIASGGFLLGGLMFGPDLDIHSVQYKRWGVLRWIWLPYRKSMHHRSALSHGPILGTMLRVIYFLLWLVFFGLVAIALIQYLGIAGITHADLGDSLEQAIRQHPAEWLIGLIGLELGALSHYVSDSTLSTYKRVRKQGLAGLKPKAKKSRRSSSRKSSRSSSKPSARSKR